MQCQYDININYYCIISNIEKPDMQENLSWTDK